MPYDAVPSVHIHGLYRFDRCDRRFQGDFVPFAVTVSVIKFMYIISRPIKNFVDIMIAEGRAFYGAVAEPDLLTGQFRVKQFISRQCCPCVLSDSVMRILIQLIAVIR